MADYTITVPEVKVLVPAAIDAIVAEYIALLTTVDACLEGAGVVEASGKSLKRLAAAHMSQLTLNGGRGAVVSESVPAGSRSFAAWRGGTIGLASTPFGAMISSLDRSGCITGLFDMDGPHLFLGTAGT